jgi:hypothetical protein
MERAITRSRLLGLIAVLSAALLLVIAYKLSPVLRPPADIQVMPELGCNVQHGKCSAALPDGRIELEFMTRPVPLARSFQVSLATPGVEPDKVEIDFAGVDMDFGYNRTALKYAGDGRYVADAALPVCLTGQMKWCATVILHRGGERLIIPFEFLSGGDR